MTGNTDDIRDIAFLNSDRLVSTDGLGNLHVWHVPQGELLCTLRCAPTNPARHLSVSPECQHVAFRLDNGQVELLDIARP